MESIFTDKTFVPSETDLKAKLGVVYPLWSDLKSWTFNHLRNPNEEWKFPGKKYGWSYRIREKARNIIYFIPGDGYFHVALVFGQKATDQIMTSDISEIIKTDLMNARAYVEGRGVRIEVRDHTNMEDIKKLIRIKNAY